MRIVSRKNLFSFAHWYFFKLTSQLRWEWNGAWLTHLQNLPHFFSPNNALFSFLQLRAFVICIFRGYKCSLLGEKYPLQFISLNSQSFRGMSTENVLNVTFHCCLLSCIWSLVPVSLVNRWSCLSNGEVAIEGRPLVTNLGSLDNRTNCGYRWPAIKRDDGMMCNADFTLRGERKLTGGQNTPGGTTLYGPHRYSRS